MESQVSVFHRLFPMVALFAAFALVTPAHAERIKDLGTFQGVRPNQLTGYGIVVGLAGTGDDSTEFDESRACAGMAFEVVSLAASCRLLPNIAVCRGAASTMWFCCCNWS